jgi:hypothetical protein
MSGVAAMAPPWVTGPGPACQKAEAQGSGTLVPILKGTPVPSAGSGGPGPERGG